MKIAIAQINPTVGALKDNQKLILDYLKKAVKMDADIVVFPECAITGYPPEDLLFKEHFISDNIKSLKEIAKKTKDVAVIVGFVDRDKKKNIYNAAAFIENKKIKTIYHKNELPNYGVFDEKRYFSVGKNAPVISYKGNKIGINICEDMWIEGAVYQKQIKKGANVLINLSASPYDSTKRSARDRLMKNRAQQGKVTVVCCNLVGGQDELVFDGHSRAYSPQGKVLGSGKSFEEDLFVVDIKSSEKVRQNKNLTKIEEIYKALILGTRDYVVKNGFKRVVIGLSGGIDSAVVAAIAVRALGQENVIGVSMPTRFNSKETQKDAKRLAKSLNIEFKELPIESLYKEYLELFKHEFKGTKPGVAEENLQARIRGNLLMTFTNKFGWLLLTTGNKSEIAVGYCTLYGDMCGGFSVIKDISKSQVFDIARFINNQGEAIIPESIIKRPPSAELRANQKDQDSLPDYQILDELLEIYIEKHGSVSTMSRKQKGSLVKKVINLVDRNEYKRRQSPPGIKISPRAFGKDWRLPITNKYKEHS